MLGADEKLILGKGYEERLSVRNSGTIEEYVRVMIYRYWEKDGTEGKLTDLSPDFIDLKKQYEKQTANLLTHRALPPSLSGSGFRPHLRTLQFPRRS